MLFSWVEMGFLRTGKEGADAAGPWGEGVS